MKYFLIHSYLINENMILINNHINYFILYLFFIKSYIFIQYILIHINSFDKNHFYKVMKK